MAEDHYITTIEKALSDFKVEGDSNSQSRALILKLKNSLETCSGRGTRRVFCKTAERPSSGSEFLWDIAVVESSKVKYSNSGTKDRRSVVAKTQLLFACEVENDQKPKAMLHDFSKLVFCTAQTRLFLGGIKSNDFDHHYLRQIRLLKEAYSECWDTVESIYVGFYRAPKALGLEGGSIQMTSIRQLKDIRVELS